MKARALRITFYAYGLIGSSFGLIVAVLSLNGWAPYEDLNDLSFAFRVGVVIFLVPPVVSYFRWLLREVKKKEEER